MATNPNLVNATAGQRLAARAVDSVPLLVLALVVLRVPGQLALIFCGVGAAAYLLWTWLWEAGSGQTPGNRLLSLRTVNEDGQAPGLPAVLVRNLLLLVSAATVVGPWILTVSNLWDHPHRRQGWHDKAARTLMVDIRAGRDPLVTGGRWIHGAPGPEQPDASVPAAAAAYAPASVRSAAAPAAPADDLAARIGAGFPAPERTGWVPAAEVPAGPVPISSVPGAPVRPAAEPAAASAAAPGAAPGSAPSPAPALGAPAAAAGPAPDQGDEEDDVEMTRVVSRPRSTGRLLTFDDGATVRVAGTALLGRNPAAAIGESADQLIDFADMGRSVSKTHLHLQADGVSGLWVTDRNSTNGSSVVAPDGRHVALEAHSPVLAPTGSTVYFGDRHFTIA
ncbi:RDD family protein [Arthrobacter sp. Sa2BUA2]|uniref:RDD family protein n=1 Tax=Arthrobacter pullicola TaxID=2762224 RepID=A0ABR8YFM9_9MICC|nr:RDD family protein [Arthrobacter pullicola]MBD8043027.1 RDD family protein [Arthrobacter pullicola]